MSYIRTCLGGQNNMLGWCRTYNQHVGILYATHPPLLDITDKLCAEISSLSSVLLILRGNALNQILGPV